MNRIGAIAVVLAATVAVSGCSLLRGPDPLPAPSTPSATSPRIGCASGVMS